MEIATDRIEAKVELTRASILAAAEARFSEYGYTKTTLVEVAQAADMSAANLYRFFENKLDIAAAMALRILDQREQALRAAVADAAGSAAQRLEDFVLAALRFDRELEAGSRHLPKLLERVIEERKEVAVAHRKARQEMLEQVVAEGVATGEFAECDAGQAAKTIRAAIVLFDTPNLNRQYPIAELERLALATVRMLIAGLRGLGRA
jgi:AcrR family transcriptional regulator